MSRDLESFERELEGAGDWRDAFRVALDGLVNNKFTLSLREINETNLPTLELRNPDAYATIKNRKTREALVVSGLFQVGIKRSLRAKEDVEICWDTRIDSDRILRAIFKLSENRESGTQEELYTGADAVKVFLRALYSVISEMREDGGKKFNELHKITHGREMRYGTPLYEINICSRVIIESLKRAIQKLINF